ncbi:MAG TPA: hypothetical protein VM510_12065 [Caulifigura sp.]|nr:hypothetical protein [Caulifigura sp.]
MRFLLTLLCIVLPLLPGCGNNDGRVTVTGTVLFDDKPLEAGRVIFTSNTSGSAGVGAIENGKFSLDQSASATGVKPGDYVVVIQSWIKEPGTVGPDGNFLPGNESRIPVAYMNMEKSGLSARVEAGKANDFTFKLSSKGPGAN